LDAFVSHGIYRVHWECWSNCSLSCEFCFRSRSAPLRGQLAIDVVRAIATGGARDLVFAGGDPSLHPEIRELVSRAKDLEMWVEIQTNGQSLTERFKRALRLADSVGVSLDSSDPAVHDAIRHRKGNFYRVKNLLDWLQDNSIPTTIRSVVTRKTVNSLMDLGQLLQEYPVVQRWAIQELTPVGDAVHAWDELAIQHDEFTNFVLNAQERYGVQVTSVSNEEKGGAYALVRSDGKVYGTGGQKIGAFFPISGDLLADHISEIVARLPFLPDKHSLRYADTRVR